MITAQVLRDLPDSDVAALLEELGPKKTEELQHNWEFWARPEQLEPEGIWNVWVALAGRGWGKTRAGAEWVRSQVEGARPLDTGRARRLALVAETLDQARDVMIFGDSGIMACSPPDRWPIMGIHAPSLGLAKRCNGTNFFRP